MGVEKEEIIFNKIEIKPSKLTWLYFLKNLICYLVTGGVMASVAFMTSMTSMANVTSMTTVSSYICSLRVSHSI